ncbi:MAG: putative MPP superfamily phosphohydrolase [Arcticibacterium sp.]|jgi:predicted MPP superfamily phosphohydrolase
MNRTIAFLLLITILLLLDWYIFSGLKFVTRSWSDTSQKLLSFIYWFIPIASILSVVSVIYVFNDRLSYQVRTFIISIIFIIYISKFISGILLLVTDIIGLLQGLYASIAKRFGTNSEVIKDAGTISRSEFLTTSALAVGAAHVGALTWGIISGAHDYRIRRTPLILKNLPAQFHGLKLIQISDIHSGSFFNKTAVEGGVDMLLKEKPDMVFFTGDLVNNKAEELTAYFDIFKRIKAPLGVYSTLGNHDYGDYTSWPSEAAKMANIKDLMKAHELMNWNLLMDENKTVTIENESIGILGIQNWGAGFSQYGNLDKALKNTDDLNTKLLLSHDPSHWRHQVLKHTNIDASFAGHTHGMQYGVEVGDFKWSPVSLRYKEWAGLYTEEDQHLYVNRGYGYLGYPGRLGILPEITVFELKKLRLKT